MTIHGRDNSRQKTPAAHRDIEFRVQGAGNGRVRGGGLRPREQERDPGVLGLGAVGAVPESVVADFVESLGQDVLEEAPHELVSADGDDAPLSRLAVFVAEGDGALS